MNNHAKDKTKTDRQHRLSAALRENLRRRKAQAKARSLETANPHGRLAHDSAGISHEDKEEDA